MKHIYLLLAAKMISNIAGVGIILFVSAGTLHYPTGWIFIALLVAAALIYVHLMLKTQPQLLEKRLIYRENNLCQQIVIFSSLLICIAMLCLTGLSFRYGWYSFPAYRYIVSGAIAIPAALLLRRVMKENAFLTSEITVQEDQRVIQTGPYGLIRHPMYTAMWLLSLAGAIALGSVWSLLGPLLFLPVLILRVCNEEKLLMRQLPGYWEYTQKTKYRLIPFIW